jgi:hypothetical protein
MGSAHIVGKDPSAGGDAAAVLGPCSWSLAAGPRPLRAHARANADVGVPASPDGGMPAGHGGNLEAQFARTIKGIVRVPARDTTPPRALLELDTGAGRPIVHDSPVRSRPQPAVRLPRPEITATALIRDPDGGSGRIRVSVEYVTRCAGDVRQHGEYFPPAQIESVRIAPGVRVPIQRERTAHVRFPANCVASGKVFAEATNACSLESFSDPVWFRYTPP